MSSVLHEDAGTMPSGTITFVFTDIEGSADRWERDRVAMQRAVDRHDALMRAAIAAHDGHVFKTIGNAFCVAFSLPEDAVAAMFDAQRALATEDFSAVGGLCVRAAIHTGTADERDRDYFGAAVNRVARLLAVAHGGQVLVSGVTGDLVHGLLPPQASLLDLGRHRLKDLSRSEVVFQLLGPELAADFPPLRSVAVLPNNLPVQSTTFVGREIEIAEITKLVENNRLITLVGSGGVGKTRTSLQVAANLPNGPGDGVWFVELAPLSKGDLIPSTVANVLGLALPVDGDQIDHLVRALHEKRALLVFDNCEHLVEASARVIAAIVRGCPHVTTLASSRQGLRIGGEITYRIPPLATPRETDGDSLSAADAAPYAAVALFAERARASDQRFALTDENAADVADICRRLDGIALAIELAAARARVLSPKQLREKLDERFRILTGGARDALPRQQTLRALIDWSYDLLEDSERTLFRRLAIFVDGFSLEGASAIASVDDPGEFAVFDIVASLVEKSLVLAETSGDTVRYRLLESTRAYALEKLRDAGERDLIADRHVLYLCDFFSDLRRRREATADGADMVAAFGRELDGVRFALDDALSRSSVAAGAELLAAIGRTWSTRGLAREGVGRIEAFIAALPHTDRLRLGQLSATLAPILCDQGMADHALEVGAKACAYARESGDGPTLALALRWYAQANIDLCNFADADAALTEMAAISPISARLRALLTDARIALSLATGDLDAAARGCEQMIADQRALGNLRGLHVTVHTLAEVEHARGRTARAIALVREVLPALRSTNDAQVRATTLANLAGYLLAYGDLSGTREAAREAIETLARESDHYLVTIALEHLALVDALQGRFSRAARIAAYADCAYDKNGRQREYTERTTHERLFSLLDAKLAPETRARLGAEGAALTAEAAVALALERESP